MQLMNYLGENPDKQPPPDGPPTAYAASFACIKCGATHNEDGEAPPGISCVQARADLGKKHEECEACGGDVLLVGFGWGNPADPTINQVPRAKEAHVMDEPDKNPEQD